ncbi:BCCT family transporter [Tepidibacter hydrothermalis]|uniref:BCCT family transporter n=1 Tax=Tepidibacter hydrothermalis TaxID=3036126 RepID=A0ABY8EAP0_9FIRM|nr:BCCT family transporter [Tepidibacter hydrothermalis]WFD09980.1 BCCT family transporter [Tepidibacter hydrothermalis]
MDINKVKIDKTVFFGALIALLAVALPIIIMPERSGAVLSLINNAIITKFGSFFILFGLFCLMFCFWVSFSRYGKIVLGDEGEKSEFSTFSWSAMLFCAGVGAGVVYWGVIEWVYYYKAPPLGVEVGSWQAAEMAAAYGIFHWGPMAWAIYSVTSCAVGYIIFVRKGNILKLSEACRGLLGNRVDGIVGKLIDISFVFGIVGGVATSLGLGSPLVTAGLSRVFGLKETPGLQIGILFLVTCIFGISAYSGLKKGIKVLSDLNVVLALGIILFVFLAGNTIFIIEMGTTSLGVVATNFFRMSTWLDPAGKSMFPQSWTVFYWAWWAAYAPFLGMFIARISKGRTIKQMVMGSLVYGSAGCVLFFAILGNYGLDLQLSGKLDVVATLNKLGGPQTIISILETLPLGKLIIFLVVVLSVTFMATSYDSASYILAANSQTKVGEDGEPIRWLRLVWAFSLALIPIGFILLGSPLKTLQTASLVFGIPVCIVVIMTGFSFVKMVKSDIKENKLKQKVVIDEFKDIV